MKKILSLVLVLMLCVGVVAMAESAATVAPTSAPTKVPSPSYNPTRSPDTTATPAPTKKPSATKKPSSGNGGSSNNDTPATQAPAATTAPAPVEITPVVEGATIVPAPVQEVNALLAQVQSPATLFAQSEEALLAVLGRDVMGATIATIRFDNLVPGQDVPFKANVPSNFALKDNDPVVAVVGIKDAYGAYTYKPVVGKVVGGKIELPLTYEMASAIQSSENTQIMFFKA